MFVYLAGGDAIWRWIQGRSSPGNRDRVAVGGAVAWNAASSKVRGIALVALIDNSAPDPRRSKSTRARPLSHRGDPDRPQGDRR